MRDPNAARQHFSLSPSALRKAQDSITDPKYDGVKTSRSKLFGKEWEGERWSKADADEEQKEEGHVPSQLLSSPSPEDEETDEVDDHDSEYEEVGDEDEGVTSNSHGPKQGKAASMKQTEQEKAQADVLAVSLQKTRVADKQKGRAVTQQLRIWDNLVDARIRLQKTAATSNKLPHPNDIKSFTENTENSEVIHKFLSEALRLSEDILELRRTLLQKTGPSPPPRKKRRIELEIALESESVDFENLVKESTEEMMEFESQTHLETLTILQKWSAKVQAVAPAALLSSTKVSFKSGSGQLKSAGELVDEALRDSERLIKRTWGKTVRIGAGSDGNTEAGSEEKGDEETFDDKEFYQAMLRDVIESKGGKDAEVYINPNRQKKNKKIDTKASKGRKLRLVLSSHQPTAVVLSIFSLTP